MRPSDPQLVTVPPHPRGRAVIVTSYGTANGREGVSGHAHDTSARLFTPLLTRWGEVVPAAHEQGAVDAAVRDARRRGLDPVHLACVDCPDMVFASSAPNVLVAASEYPDVPSEAFDGNAQNDWVSTADRCDLVLACGDFTAQALRRAGVRTPVAVVPVPTPDDYFRVPPWRPDSISRIACGAYSFPDPAMPAADLWDAPDVIGGDRRAWAARLAGALRRGWGGNASRFLPPVLSEGIRAVSARVGDRWRPYLRRCRRAVVELSGVLYTCVVNPGEVDVRDNWQDLLTGFVTALGDRPDATLVVQLAPHGRAAAAPVLDFYRGVGLRHRCKIVFVTDHLSDEQMLELARASSYYLTTARASRLALSLRTFLAAGRPAVAPCHSAIGDCFDRDAGLTVPWHPEPAPWPRDPRARIRTTWARLDWAALVERLRASYALARHDRPAYDALAECARRRMREQASAENVWPRLAAALGGLNAARGPDVRVA